MRAPAAPDLAIGAFSDQGPWCRSSRNGCAWRHGVDGLRAASQAQRAEWVRRRRVAAGAALPARGRARRLRRRLLAALRQARRDPRRRARPVAAAALAFEALGLVVHQARRRSCRRGRASFPTSSWPSSSSAAIGPARAVQTCAGVEAGARGRSKRCSRASTEPLASASIAQVHAAQLRTGEEVVVKVQRPQVATLVRQDVAAMAWIALYPVGRIPVAALANPPALVELFAETISEELDFRLEAQNMLDIAHVLPTRARR